MSYKTDLQANNTALQAALTTAQSLPDAGSGGSSVDICTVRIILTSTTKTLYAIDYVTTDTSGNIVYKVETPNINTGAKTITCVCGSHIFIDTTDSTSYDCTNATIVYGAATSGSYDHAIFQVTDDPSKIATIRLVA